MSLTSLLFIELFLPAVLILYYLLGFVKNAKAKMTARNVLLLVSSLLFYTFGGFYMVLFFAALILVDFVAGLAMGKLGEEKKGARRAVFLVSMFLNIGTLVFFNYGAMILNFIDMAKNSGNAGNLFRGVLSFTGRGTYAVVAFLGISFTVFQSISYLTDVYLRKIEPSKNFLSFSLYLTLFFKILEGPIMRYGTLGAQIENREHSLENFAKGIRRFIYGLGKKVLIANVVAEFTALIFTDGSSTVPGAINDISTMGAPVAWLGLVLYTLQIYFDFSGYSDMAVGIGAMFGFKIDENFNYPYTSLSVQEFWRRWHISLSTWFKDYIYIPLGGSRKGKARACLNVAIVFLISGIWHGANLTFVVWGLIFVAANVIERLFLGDLLKKNPVKPINWLYTMAVVMFGWVFFNSSSLERAGQYLKQMFSFKGSNLSIISYLNYEAFIALFLGILLCGAIQRPLSGVRGRIEQKNGLLAVYRSLELVLLIAIFVFCIIQLVGGSHSVDIYAGFGGAGSASDGFSIITKGVA